MALRAPDPAVIRDSVALACRAPSLHNSQPWHWVAESAALHLWADPRRSMPGTDRSGRELTLSCGAVLDHLRVAVAAAGWDAITARFPDPDRPDHLATLTFWPRDAVSASQRRLADAILQRRTDRLPFAAPAGWTALESRLRAVATRSDVMLDVVGDNAREGLAEASRLTETLRRYDISYQTELRWWTSPFTLETGVPQDALVSSAEASRVDVARAFPPVGGGQRRADIDVDHSKVVVLSTPHGDTALDLLRCGEALSAVLLECTVAGMATCTLTHMTEVAPSRDIIAQLIGQHGMPQVLIRVGRTPAAREHAAPTARRPLVDVLEFRGQFGGRSEGGAGDG